MAMEAFQCFWLHILYGLESLMLRQVTKNLKLIMLRQATKHMIALDQTNKQLGSVSFHVNIHILVWLVSMLPKMPSQQQM